MRTKKKKQPANFDSLAFKTREQKRLQLATKGMTWEQKVEYLHQQSSAGPFDHLLKDKKGRSHAAAREKRSPYKAR